MVKKLIADNLTVELIKRFPNGKFRKSVETKTFAIIANPLFFEMLEGKMEEKEADEVRIRHKNNLYAKLRRKVS